MLNNNHIREMVNEVSYWCYPKYGTFFSKYNRIMVFPINTFDMMPIGWLSNINRESLPLEVHPRVVDLACTPNDSHDTRKS